MHGTYLHVTNPCMLHVKLENLMHENYWLAA